MEKNDIIKRVVGRRGRSIGCDMFFRLLSSFGRRGKLEGVRLAIGDGV